MLNRYLRVLLCKHYLFFSWLLIPVASLSQSPDSSSMKTNFWHNASIGSRFYFGSYLTTKAKAEYIRDSYASFGELFFEFQTKGLNSWELSHRYPSWGLGLLYGNSGSREYIGNVSALYAYLNLPVIRSAKYNVNFLIGTGPGIVSRPFNIYSNPKNTLIGTRLNAFINLGFQNDIKISGKLSLSGGLHFIHVSNGGTTLPNLGLNTPCIYAGIKYSFNKPDSTPLIITDQSYREIRFKIFTSVSVKQAPWIGGNHYLINVLQTEAAFRRKLNYSFGPGIMFTYNRSLDFFPLENPSYEKRGQKKLQIGTYASYEHFFGKLSVPLQLGVYVYNKAKSPLLFQQFGLRYRIQDKYSSVLKNLSAELLLKSHMGQADFIHIGLGYTF